MNNLIKVLVGLGTTGTITTGGYFIFKSFSSPKNVGEFLVKEGFKILDLSKIPETGFNSSLDYDNWVSNFNKHNQSSEENKFSGLSTTSDVANLNKFKEECKKVLEISLENEEGLEKKKKQAQDWCAIKEQTV